MAVVNPSPPGRLRALVTYLVVTVLCGSVMAGLASPGVGLTAFTAKRAVTFFDSLPDDLDVTTESQQSRLLYSDGSTMARFYYQNRINVPMKLIAPVMGQAVVAIEDWRFYRHSGADLQGIARALVNNVTGHDRQGASTLTQQWVRNLLLEQARNRGDAAQVQAQLSGDNARKISEIRLAVAAERRFGKEQILNNYLNIALFGDNQYGVQTAVQHFLSKSAKQLTLADAALLAGMVQQPTRFNPLRHPRAAERRRNVVLAAMRRHGYITSKQYTTAVRVPVRRQVHPRNIPNGCQQAGSAAFFCDYVTHVIARDAAFGEDAVARGRLLYRGGLTIRTTLRRPLQDRARQTLTERTAVATSPGVGASVVTVEPGTGRILAMAQNRPYSPAPSPRHTTTALNYNVDAKSGGSRGFQTGSAYKPFTLAAWLAAGRTLTERVDASRVRYDLATSFTDDGCGPRPTGTWFPDNAEGGGAGPMSVLDATAASVNTAYVAMAARLSLCRIRDVADSLGVHPGAGGSLGTTPASVLGTNEVAPLTMAAAFAGFAADGQYCRPVAVLSVRTPAGRTLPVPSAGCRQVLPRQVASGVNTALAQVLTRGTMRGVGGIGRPAAGKTGTTDRSKQTWFVGYTPRRLSTAVWVGTPDGRPGSLNGALVGGERHAEVFGATVAGRVWRDYMSRAVAGTPVTAFTPYSPTLDRVGARRVPTVRGMSPQEATSTLAAEDLGAETAGTIFSDVPPGEVAATDPGPGTLLPDGATVRLILSKGAAPAPSPSSTGSTTAAPGAAARVSPTPSPTSAAGTTPPVGPASSTTAPPRPSPTGSGPGPTTRTTGLGTSQ